MDLSEQHEKIIKEWAASTRYIQAVRLFGSRARGRAPDSDVDLAVTVGGATPEEARGNYYAEKARWQQELTALLGMQADVELQRARRRYRAALLRRVQQVPVRAPAANRRLQAPERLGQKITNAATVLSLRRVRGMEPGTRSSSASSSA